MNQFESKVFKDIAERLAVSIPEWCGAEASFDKTQEPTVRSFAHSFIARYLVTGPKELHILVKIAHRPNQTDLQDALESDFLRKLTFNEMGQLKATWQAFQQLGDPDLTAVQPLAYLEPWNAIVMFEVKARALRTQIVSPQIGFSQPAASAELIEHLKKAGRWLRYYHHHVGGSQALPVSKQMMQERLDKISQDVDNHLRNNKVAQDALMLIKTQIDSISGLDLIAQQHGDFHCSNILVTPAGSICVLDPRADTSHLSIYNDLATLFADIYLKPTPILTNGLFAQKFLKQSRQAILQSYFEVDEFSEPLFNFYCACEIIFKWSMAERDFNRRSSMRALAPLMRPFYTRYMSSLIEDFT